MPESQPSHDSPWIIDVSDESFERDVIERSQERPVVIDFWAAWCGPCRMLAPALEKQAREGEGNFLLAKVNVDEAQQTAAAFGVQSIPTVFAVRDGKIVDQFVGVLSEDQLAAWLEGLQPTPAETALAAARELAENDPAQAEAKFREAVELAPQESAPKIELARLLLHLGKVDESQQLADELAERGYMEPEAEDLLAELKLRHMGDSSGDVQTVREASRANPDDLELRWQLAQALAGAAQYEEALELGLSLVQDDKANFGERSREMMVDIFHLLGPDSELVSQYRRKLSSALY